MIHEGITMPYDAIRCHTMPYLDIMYTYENPYSIMVKKNSDIYKIYMRHVYKKIKKNYFRSFFFFLFTPSERATPQLSKTGLTSGGVLRKAHGSRFGDQSKQYQFDRVSALYFFFSPYDVIWEFFFLLDGNAY